MKLADLDIIVTAPPLLAGAGANGSSPNSQPIPASLVMANAMRLLLGLTR